MPHRIRPGAPHRPAARAAHRKPRIRPHPTDRRSAVPSAGIRSRRILHLQVEIEAADASVGTERVDRQRVHHAAEIAYRTALFELEEDQVTMFGDPLEGALPFGGPRPAGQELDVAGPVHLL